jgi:hypothetical protein
VISFRVSRDGEAGPSSINQSYLKLLGPLNQDGGLPQEGSSNIHQIPADPMRFEAIASEETHTEAPLPKKTENQFHNMKFRGGISDLINVSCVDDRNFCYAIQKRQNQLSMDGDWE